jgi:hypothetical protein
MRQPCGIGIDSHRAAKVAIAAVKTVLRKLLLFICALYLSGAHWAVLQVTAWTGMIVSRSQTSGVAKAVATTFDGEHPCAMCDAIASGQKEEKQGGAEFPALRAMEEVRLLISEGAALPLPSLSGETGWMEFSGTAAVRALAPPTPPPRAA